VVPTPARRNILISRLRTGLHLHSCTLVADPIELHVALRYWGSHEPPDHLGVAEGAGRGIPRGAGGDRADVAGISGRCLGAHYGRIWFETLRRFGGCDVVIGGDEG
jgi:hypothetical protein